MERDTSAPIEQQIVNLLDVIERMDIEMHNYQVRINNALKSLVERIEHVESASHNRPTVCGETHKPATLFVEQFY